MTPITKDTPIGTRVLVVWDDFKRLSAEPFRAHVASIQGERVECRRRDGSIFAAHRSNVFVDEPAPGTWAWACERALNNQPTVRDRGRVKLEMVNDTLRLLVRYRDGWDYVDFGRDDLAATDWEIAK